MAGCLIDKKIESKFRRHRVRDSKTLTAKSREYLAKLIKKYALAYEVLTTSPDEIDKIINGKNFDISNINKLEAAKSAEIINTISRKIGKEPIKVIIDCPSPNRGSWQKYLIAYLLKLNKDINHIFLCCEHKADVNHIAVSAASILAKSRREEEVEKIKKKIGKDFGSGYSHDPVTIKFLKEYYKEHKKDGIFRESWGTIKNHKLKKEQKKIGEF